ncbi:hypothetical protein L226DRAFT_609030 [Lentinus tigrinus ALCF2SS1-7]|uniref:BRCT domain-containing protein n=1 Tax=Lentinus tigrinus ALCF2SS1-6 TaxID=1328759 RepID=A0A5C2SS11_9APHY|nr:hypothetical protein L227DRAFT_648909 [Lentinus tigrinus ALCF2SS1-6]RPD80063.1 hypothetical protein L226DRAFT_609030 [Lentinus tigrinus ALCF2SS1-7]
MVMASVNESRSDESQASQLIAAALKPRDVQPVVPAPTVTQEQQSDPLEGSLQSSGHSVHYHVHGLLATQTQSLLSGEDQSHPQGSQKENTPASWDQGQSSPPPISSPLESPIRPPPAPSYTTELKESPSNILPIKPLIDKPCLKEIGERINTIQTPAKSFKAVSFASPSRLPSRPPVQLDRASTLPAPDMPPPPWPRPRSPSPTSQDSFAGPLPQPDPAKAFIARERKFAIPLSQLGDTQSTSDEEGPPPVASDMWTSPRRDPVVRGSSLQEKILVAGTPSNSSHDSQSQRQAQCSQQACDADSQPAQIDTQSSDSYPQAQIQTLDPSDFPSLTQEDGEPSQNQATHTQPSSPAYASTEPTSSYPHFLDGPYKESQPDDDTPPTQLATQVTELADETPPTQIATPIDDMDASAIAREHEFFNENGQYEAPSVRSNARSTNTSRRTDRLGLLSLVAPEKRYRYEHIVPEQGAPRAFLPRPSPARHVTPSKETQPSDIPSSPVAAHDSQASEFVEQTQPSDVAVNGSVVSTLPPRRGLPPANWVLQNRRPQSPAPSSPLSAISGFVPDSEGPTQADTGPTQIAEAPAPPTRRGLPSASRAVSRATPSVARTHTQLYSEDEVFRAITTDEPSVHAIAEEEEEEEEETETVDKEGKEEEEEEEVPLAAAVQSSKAKGKQKASEPAFRSTVPNSPIRTRGQVAKLPQSPTKSGIIRDSVAGQRTASWKDVVPSSDPQERHEDAKAAAAAKPRKPRTPVPQAPPPRTRTAPRAAKLAARGKLYESSTEDEDEDDEDDVDIPDNRSDDHDTAPANEDDMDVDPPDIKPKLPVRHNKRKRTVSSTSRKGPSKPSGSKVKEESATPATRPAKRAKTASVMRGAGNHVPTRVFGLWRQNGQYFPGVAVEMVGSSKCRVKFDDGDEEILELKHIRLCQLKTGDSILHPWSRAQKGVPIVDVPECPDTGYLPDDTITVEIDDEYHEVDVQSIRIASRTVQAEWDDRLLTEETIVPQIRPKLSRPSPTPSRLSVPSEGSTRGATKKPLAKTGLIMSFSPNSEYSKYVNSKNDLMAQIKRHGGVVLDDWTNLYTMEGVVEYKGQQWTLTADDIQWKKTKDIDRVFLISDDNHQKPKFLIALALGIPCVSVEWLKAVMSGPENMDWHRYLLPAGFSEHLNARVSQMVDLDWGSSIHHLMDITANLVAPGVFADKTILCISPDFVPSKQKSKKNGNTTDKNASFEMVPRIILCMGAAVVESVTDPKYANRGLEDYDLVVVHKDQDLARYSKKIEHCVEMSWVKDCLISRQLLTLPSQLDDS